ncbi:metalloprotein [Mannheimia granulomatis]|uniref:Metalloprotein n=1 Tax=Mannheimia granulomatis TaxID=85402 RepID=A0A6G8JJW1_9PAST|nr:VOC family protein [Mannheimia granulomatis]QIM67356.1 metalloprotein [Mannheimia granulomatis]
MDRIVAENAKFFEKMTACFGDLSQFEQKIQQIAEVAGIDLSFYQIDHLAVRMNQIDTAEKWKDLLLEKATLLKESIVNGRPIGLFTLEQAVKFCRQNVKIVELPFPKDKIYPEEGWEHIEIVFPFLVGETVEQWIERSLSYFKLLENSELKVKVSHPQVSGEQLPNPSIAITLRNVTFCNTCCLKLHPYDINDIVMSEI